MFQQLVFCELQLSFHVKIVGARCAMGPMSKKNYWLNYNMMQAMTL
jgi:hypothetical protein